MKSMCCYSCVVGGRRCPTSFTEGRRGSFHLVEVRPGGRRRFRTRLRESAEADVMAALLELLGGDLGAEEKVARALALVATHAMGGSTTAQDETPEPQPEESQESRRPATARALALQLEGMRAEARELRRKLDRQERVRAGLRGAINAPAAPNSLRDALARSRAGAR